MRCGRPILLTRLQRAGVSPREAMELARHSDMRLTMKTYTDVAQLPLAATVRGLPSIGDSQIDSQTLVADRPAMSPSVIGLKPLKVGKTTGNIDENHNASSIVTFGHENENGGERGIRTPSNSAENNGNPHNNSQRDSQIPVPSSSDLSQVVTAWEKLPAPFKAAILAIVKSAE
jgi:hypothetical protein